jgi:hypothetical protein
VRWNRAGATLKRSFKLAAFLLVLFACGAAHAQCSNASVGVWTCGSASEGYSGSTAETSVSTGAFSYSPSLNAVVLAFAAYNSSAACSTPTDTIGNTWALVGSNIAWNNSQNHSCLYYAINKTAASDTVTCKAATSSKYFVCDAIWVSGNLAVSPLDKNCGSSANASTSGTAANNEVCSAAITPTVNGELIIADQSSTGTVSKGSAFTSAGIAANSFEYYYQASAAAITPAFDNTASGSPYGMLAVALKPAATAQTYAISGTITGASGATVTLSSGGTTVATLTSGASGSTYTFTNVANGTYTVTPTLAGYTFAPSSASVTVSGGNATISAFTATTQTYTVSGTITGAAGAKVTLSSGGTTVATLTSGASGSTYTFTNVANGTYTVTPTLAGYTFTPSSASVTVSGGNATISAFTATTQTYTVSGTITGAAGAKVTLSSGGTTVATLTSGASGSTYTFTNVANGTYTVTPTLAGYTFTPSSASVTVSGGNATISAFTATTQTYTVSGTITGAAGATVTLSSGGTTLATLVSGAPGSTYTFSSVANGTYTVTPTLSGYAFTPSNASVTVSGGNATVSAFTATAGAPCSDTSVGVWTCGSASEGYSGSTAETSVSTGAFSYSPSLNAVVLAFAAYNSSAACSTPTDTIGNTWALVGSNIAWNNSQNHSCLYYAINKTAASDTVTCKAATSSKYFVCDAIWVSGNLAVSPLDKNCGSSANASTSGTAANNEVCSAAITPTVNGELIIADQSSTGTVSKGSAFTSAGIAANSFEYYYQASAAAITPAFDNTASGSPYGMLAVALKPAATAQTYAISGTITGASGATVTLSSGGTTVATLTSGASGSTYTFTNVANGTYTVTPTLAGYTFAPSSASVTISGGNATVSAFAATALNPAPTLTSVTPPSALAGATAQTLTLTGTNFESSSTVIYNGVGHTATYVSATQLTIQLSVADQTTAGTYAVVVTNPGPGGGTSSAVNFVVDNPAPTLTSVSPPSALAGAAAQTLTLTGTNLLATSTVTYNGVGHTATYVSATQLTIQLSVADQTTAGTYAVVVTNPGPGGGASSAVSFAVDNPAPTLSSVSPPSALAGAAAQTLTLTGTNLESSSTVTYNGVGHAATYVSATQLTISLSVADQAPAGSYAVVVTNPGPGGGTSSAVNFAVDNPQPTLSSVTPPSALAGAAAQTLTLTGTNFVSSSTVTYNGVGHAATYVSGTQLTISLSTADQATAGTYPVVVTNPGPGGGTSSAVNFAVDNPQPTLTSVSPPSALTGAAAQTLTLTGTNFVSSSTVTYNGVGHAATYVSATQLTIQLSLADQATAGSDAVVVTNPGQGGGTSSAVSFVVDYPVPTLSSASPPSALAGAAAQTLTLTGTNFVSSSTVTYNGVGHTATYVSATQLTIQLSVADQATAGSYAVVVTNPGPGGGTSNAVSFVVDNPQPTLSSVSPPSALAGAAAQTLTLTGTNFVSSSTVTYNGVGHTATYVSATQLTIQLSVADQATAGSDPVVVTNPGPGGGTSSAVSFVVDYPVPTLSSASPPSALAGAAAQTLALIGTNFLATSTVTYNGVGHTATYVSATQLSISLSTADQATAGSYAVVVTNPGPGGGTSSAVSFAVDNPQPTLSSVTPPSALAGAAAQTLTLTGTNFVSGSTVTYNGVGHTATYVSGTQLTISLSTADQATAGSYALVVTNPGPGGGASSAVNFVVTSSGPVVSFSSTSLAFGSQYLGDTNTAPLVTLSNTGAANLNITSIAVTGANAGDFAETDTCGGGVAPGDNCTISVTFTPSLTALETAAVTITDNATDSPETVTLTGTGIVAAGQFMVLDPTRKFLVNTTVSPAKPVFITGEDAFSLTDELSDTDIETYLSDRASRGYNLIWIAVVDNTYNTNPPFNALGQAPFSGAPFTNMQEPYFEHLDHVIQRAAAYGITVLLNPAFSGYNCDDTYGWCPEMEAASDATMTAFGVYLGSRYKSYPNIMWLMGGDLNIPSQGQGIANKHNDVALGIKSVDTVHLMTVENIRGQSSLDEWSGASWLDLNGLYALPQDFPASANSNYQRTDFLPIFEMEDYYEGEHSMTELGLRTEAYWAVLSGAYLGQFFGNNAIWDFGNPADDTIGPWPNQLSSTGSVGRELLGNLFRSREHWRMVPDIGNAVVTSCTPNCGTADAGTLVTAARTSNGETIIAYIPNGNATTVSVNMAQITSSTSAVHAWWFNPQTGATVDLGSGFANSGTITFTPLDSNDWVLVLDDASANLSAPGSAPL